jgi:micrococcal nuclease
MARGIPRRVIDGDTFILSGGQRVRPSGFNTPEKGQPGWRSAKNALEALVLNKSVGLGRTVNMDRGRQVRSVTVGGRPLQSLMRRHTGRA